jgi:peptidoglycan/LPS O-acetylase OafA/YrhL
LCALFVALLHVNVPSHITEARFIRGSWLFVDFFFVLSGFVIAFVYLDRIDGRRTLQEFVMRRFGRLWPLHAFVLLLFMLSETVKAAGAAAGLPVHVPAFTGPFRLSPLGGNLLLVHGLGFWTDATWNPPSWSISVEFYTYLIFAGLCLVARRRIAVASAIVVGIAVAMLAVWSPRYLASGLDFASCRCLFGFFVGVLTCLLYCSRRTLPAAPFWEALSLTFAITCILACEGHDSLTMAAPLVFAAVVFTFAFAGGPVSRLLSWRCFVWLGERSYSVYMIHAFTVYMMTRVLALTGGVTGLPLLLKANFDGELTYVVSVGDGLLADAIVLLYLGAVLAAAQAVHMAVERPGRAFFNRLAVAYAASGRAAGVGAVEGLPVASDPRLAQQAGGHRGL